MQDIGSKTKSSLIWSTSLKIIYQIFRFGISVIIARILDPKDFGIMGIATMIVMYMANLTNVGFNRALIQRKDISDEHVSSAFTVNLSISVLFTIVIILMSEKIAYFFRVLELKNVLIILSSVFVMSCFLQIPLTLMRRQLDFKVVALTNLYQGILHSCIALFLAFLGFNYWALVLGLITSYIFGSLYISFKIRWKPRIRYNHSALKDIFSFGLWNFIRAQTSQINEYADKFIIGKFLGPVLLGFYEKAFSTVAVQKEHFTAQINSVMFSSFSRLQSETGDTIKKYLTKTLSAISLVIFPINFGLFALAHYFVIILLGPQWKPMIIPLKLISVAFVFNALSEICSSLNMSIGKYVNQTVRECVGNVLLIMACLFTVRYGLEFIAFGVIIVYVITFFATFHLTTANIDISWADLLESILPAMIGSLVMLLVVELSKRYFFYEINIINFISLLTLGIFTYAFVVFYPKYSGIEEYRTSLILYIKNIFNRLFALTKYWA